ncbi:MAG: ribosomal-processing cysteine protease Prp [Erysipelotrichaceae bacterium]|nr:ribosomal-processing cysteine protease Prp [Erysipelotrichaceae bacterium]
MTKCKFLKNGIDVYNHAGDPAVCTAISVLTDTFDLALKDDHITWKESGVFMCEWAGELSEDGKSKLNFLKIGLAAIEQDFPEYLCLIDAD